MRAGVLTIWAFLVLGCADKSLKQAMTGPDVEIGVTDDAGAAQDYHLPDLSLDTATADVTFSDHGSIDASNDEGSVASDVALADSAHNDGALADMTTDAGLVPRAGFTVEEIQVIISLAHPAAPPLNPTNRFADDPDVALLGQAFFFTDQLGPTFVECTTCHSARGRFTRRLSYDGQGGLNFRNVPSLVGVASMPWFFWDGRADTLWAQVRTPLEHPEEMASDRLYIAHSIYDHPEFRGAYEASFGPMPDMNDEGRFPPRGRPGGVDEAELTAPWLSMNEDDQFAVTEILANVGKAFEAYLRKLTMQESAFDRFARALVTGNQVHIDLMSERAREGLALFIGAGGCINCHHGPMMSDGLFHNLGTGAHPEDRHPQGRSLGLGEVLDDPLNAAGPFSDAPDGERARRLDELDVSPRDEGAFRTPSLRNVTRTRPYGHDGRFGDLRAILEYKVTPDDRPPGERDPLLEVVNLDDYEIDSLQSFLETLVSPQVPVGLRSPPDLGGE